MIVVMLAVGVLVLAAAKPQKSVAVPAEQATIVLVTDVSGSMLATDVPPNRLTAAKNAAKAFIKKVPRRVNIGVIAFNQVPQILQLPTTDHVAVGSALDSMTPSGSTATGEAIDSAVRMIQTRQGQTKKPPPAAIVLLSDGASRRGVDPVKAAENSGKKKIPVYTVALGTQTGTIPKQGGGTQAVPPDLPSLQKVADASGGQAFEAIDSAKLDQVYEKLGSQLGRKKEKREITTMFAGGGIALLLLGSGLSLTFLGRLI
jgi:Ca-activated chloride channel family protein